jgi:cell division protein FtsI/penicillin-binding protein 2
MRVVAWIWVLLTPLSAQTGELFRQSADASLRREFANVSTSYILLDYQTGHLLSRHWPHIHRAVPMGSLVKPLLTLAVAEEKQFTCAGGAMCWRPQGHGRIGPADAIAHSCNGYFRQLAREVDSAALHRIGVLLGLGSPPDDVPATLIGENGKWRHSPMQMAQAYRLLLKQAKEQNHTEILLGLTDAAKLGTAAAIDVAIYPGKAIAKTGTGPCTHSARAPGDGFAVVMWPAPEPRYLLLVRIHGRPGSQAAALAGKMITRLEASSRVAAD